MKRYIFKKIEVLFIFFAIKILAGRNVKRSRYVSRRDNNDMAYMAERLESITKRMNENYD